MTTRGRSLATAIRRSPILNAIINSPSDAVAFTEALNTATDGAIGGGSESVATAADLPLSGNEVGDFAFVQETNRLYIWNGNGWYNIALINTSPSSISGAEATYSLAKDGTPTVIVLNATDPEGVPLTWGYQVTAGALGSTATVENVDNVFTITPGTNDPQDTGDFTLTFSATDGINQSVTSSSFSLQFSPPPSGVLFTTVGTHNFIVPEGVDQVSAVVIGGGGGGGVGQTLNTYGDAGGGGAGGGLSYGTFAVTPGETLVITVGNGGSPGRPGQAGGNSIISRGSTQLLFAGGGSGGTTMWTDAQTSGSGGSSSGTERAGGGTGGASGDRSFQSSNGGGGGGAAGYSGNGGAGKAWHTNAQNGSGGGGGGGNASDTVTGAGGGVGVYGEGANGAAGNSSDLNGDGGSGGGKRTTSSTQAIYGGGGRGYARKGGGNEAGAKGAVRIVWGNNRAFPSTNVDLASSTSPETTV